MTHSRFSYTLSLFLVALTATWAFAADQTWTVASPDGKLVAAISLGVGGKPTIAVSQADAVVLEPTAIGLVLRGEGADLSTGLMFVGKEQSAVSDEFTVLSGKRSRVAVKASELTLTFANAAGQQLELIVRAADDGAAFRYRIGGEGDYAVESEATAYVLPAKADVWAQRWRNNYERHYAAVGSEDLAKDDWGHPVLYKTAEGRWALLGEAAVNGDYAILHFRGAGAADGKVTLKLTAPRDQRGAITGKLPLATPWRVLLAGETLAAIVESDLVASLNPPSKLEDTSWIKPGRVAWSWWSDSRSPRSLEAQKKFVDFAAEMGWEYSLVDEGWDEKWVPELIQYAKTKNVGIILWRYWGMFNEAEAKKYAGWGAVGVKLDFFDSDRQEMMRNYDRLYRLTADNKLLLNYHGCAKPSGETRTWPHHLTREGVRGGENRHLTAAENINLAFTRNVLGPMDYTPVILSKPGGRLPATFAHQLAHAVLFESGLQHFVDTPEVYRASPAKPFLMAVPVTWDDIKLLDGVPSAFVCIARQHGEDWYVGVNNTYKLTYKVSLAFLPAGKTYAAEIYYDGETPTDIAVRQQTVTRDDTIAVDLAANGGCAIRLTPKE